MRPHRGFGRAQEATLATHERFELAIEGLVAGLDYVRAAPRDEGPRELIACRPAVDERIEVEAAELDIQGGLVGDSGGTRGTSPNPQAQGTGMSARAAAAIAVY